MMFPRAPSPPPESRIAFGKAVRDTTTRLVIAVPDATELMNRAFAAFA